MKSSKLVVALLGLALAIGAAGIFAQSSKSPQEQPTRPTAQPGMADDMLKNSEMTNESMAMQHEMTSDHAMETKTMQDVPAARMEHDMMMDETESKVEGKMIDASSVETSDMMSETSMTEAQPKKM